MALRAIVDDTGVIEDAFCEVIGVVTNAAIGACRNVNVRFARRVRAIVARRTIASNTAVVERWIGEAHCIAVAGIAFLIGCHMVGVLTGCDNAVMARTAVAGNACVIIRPVRRNRHKRFGVVASIALGGGVLVKRRLPYGDHAVVAATA